ncbi:MAG: sodium:solute symporter family protein [Verrucomicrobia bacterium]|nr:sodium:solute symporter family protein [Verrucomicrobiota bacterium]
MQAATSFGTLDWAVLIAYFVGITAFGLWLSRKTRTSNGYFLGERKLPWWVMIGQAFGTGTHAEQPVAQAGATFGMGFATIWFQWKNMLITPLYWLMAPWYRRSERTTVAEIIEDRYGRKLAFAYTLFAIAFFVCSQGVMLKGAGKVISVATGGEMISANGVVIAMTAAVILYSFFGGLVASAYTDFVQSFLIITLSFMLIPLGLREVGGFSGLHKALPEHFFDLYSSASGMSAFTIVMLALNGFVGITAQPHVLSLCATGSTERAGRVGHTYGAMTKRFCTIGWALTGLIAAALVLQRGAQLPDAEHAFGYACRELLGPGLVGLMVACVLAANMSACSNLMVNSGAIFTRNVWISYINPSANDRQLLRVGRVSGLLLTSSAILFALTVGNVLHAFLFTETVAALFGVMFLGGILWRRANRAGAAAATLVAFASYYAALYLTTCAPGTAAKPADLSAAFAALASSDNLWAHLHTGQWMLVYKWLPGPFGFAMLLSCSTLIIVSLLTKPEDAARMDVFFDRRRRSTDLETVPTGQPKPLAADRGEELLLLDAGTWFTAARWRGFPRRYREDLIGFGLAWLTVGAMVLLAWLVIQIGR